MAIETFRSLERAVLDAAARALSRADAAGLRTADSPSPEVGDLAIGCHALGKELGGDPQALTAELVALGARNISIFGRVVSCEVPIAAIYVALGDREQAFAWLEKAYQDREQGVAYLKVDTHFDSLRSDPRFADLLRRLRLAS